MLFLDSILLIRECVVPAIPTKLEVSKIKPMRAGLYTKLYTTKIIINFV